MKKLAILATVAALGLSAGANAQSTITRADLTGPTGTIWTTGQTGNYTLFIRNSNTGPFFNPNDETVNIALPGGGTNQFLLNGEGFRPGETQNSDPLYTLLLTLANGSTLTGSYNPDTNTFLGGTSVTTGGFIYSLTEFSYERSLAQVVSPNVATPGGDSSDYAGNFNVSAIAAVPEPAAWAMMIVGIGAVGGSMRVRRRNAKISFA